MAQQQANLLHNLLPRFLNTVTSKTTVPLDHLLVKISRGHISASSMLSGLPVVKMTCIGRKTGLQCSVPLAYMPDPDKPDCFAVMANHFGQKTPPEWYLNVKANPRVRISIKGKEKTYIAQEIEGELYDKFLALMVQTPANYKTHSKHIPIVLLTPVKSD